jgi:hypothetical protein
MDFCERIINFFSASKNLFVYGKHIIPFVLLRETLCLDIYITARIDVMTRINYIYNTSKTFLILFVIFSRYLYGTIITLCTHITFSTFIDVFHYYTYSLKPINIVTYNKYSNKGTCVKGLYVYNIVTVCVDATRYYVRCH